MREVPDAVVARAMLFVSRVVADCRGDIADAKDTVCHDFILRAAEIEQFRY
jgi:hypothetical protein